MFKIYNESCLETMKRMSANGEKVSLILTSPFYNTNKKAGKSNTLLSGGNPAYIRYDMHVDNLTNEEYCDFTVDLFNAYDSVLEKDGCILYNLSYGSNNTEGMILAIASILQRTNFTLADIICWKKKSAFPNNMSTNKTTRITEYVFVMCRRSEFNTFRMNKRMVSRRDTGQAMYENIFNFIEAKNNDGECPLNKATFSTEFVGKLLNMYYVDGVVYDSFMGSGTTLVECCRRGIDCVGSEISPNQCKYAQERCEDEVGLFL